MGSEMCIRDRCNSTAPACLDGSTSPDPGNPDSVIPSSKVSSYFKEDTDPAEKPTWCKTTTQVPYGNGEGARQVDTPVCHVQFYIPDRLNPPVLLYYQLTNFYQNHRRYVKSFDQEQLSGTYRSAKDINGSDCDPLKGEVVDGEWKSYYPCGLIANSVFNDTIMTPVLLGAAGSSADNQTYTMTSEGTAWGTDADLYKTLTPPQPYAYGDVVPPPNWRERYPVYNETFPFPDLHSDDHFQVWMRTAGLPSFSKLYLRNDNQAMEVGRYQIDVYDCKPAFHTIRVLACMLTPPRLPSDTLRGHEVYPHFDTHCDGRQESLPWHCLCRGWRHLHCPWCTLHSNALDQA